MSSQPIDIATAEMPRPSAATVPHSGADTSALVHRELTPATLRIARSDDGRAIALDKVPPLANGRVDVARTKAGDLIANEVFTARNRVARSAMDDLTDAATFAAINALVVGNSPEVSAATDAVIHEALFLDKSRNRDDAEHRVNLRRRRLIDSLSLLRGDPCRDYITAAVFKAGGELMCNGGEIPLPWEDSVDPNCLVRGVMDDAGLEGGIFVNDDGDGDPILTLPPEAPRYDFQFAVTNVRCVEETGFDRIGSDELFIRSSAMYDGGRVSASSYDRGGFDAGEEDPTTVELLRARVAFRPGKVTTLSSLFVPVEREFLMRSDSLTAISGLLNVLANQGVAALIVAAQSVPGIGTALATVLASDAFRNAVRDKVDILAEFLADFLADDHFTIYRFNATFAWERPFDVPTVSGEIKARARDGREFFRALPKGPVTAERTVFDVPTSQVAGAGRRLISTPGFFQIDHRVKAFVRR